MEVFKTFIINSEDKIRKDPFFIEIVQEVLDEKNKGVKHASSLAPLFN